MSLTVPRSASPPLGPIAIRHSGGQGLPLVTIHGYGADRLTYTANQPVLSEVADVHALELPGHGDSGPEVGDGTVATLAGAAVAALDAAGIGGAHLVGHSLGGGVAARIAVMRPDLVRSLILIAPVGLGADIDSGFLNLLPMLESRAEAEWLLRRLVVRPSLIGPRLIDHVLAGLEAPGRRAALSRIAAGLRGVGGEMRPVYAGIAASGLRRLVIWGADDGLNPRVDDRLDAFGGERLIAPAAGHIPHVEAAPAVNRAMRAFLRGPG